MGLGNRLARKHETLASRFAGVQADLWWEFRPEQRVRTVEGLLGKVVEVQDGPHPGNETYIVALDHGMGGGEYSSSELTSVNEGHTADKDYPELGSVLTDRPNHAHALPVEGAKDDDRDDDEDQEEDDQDGSDDDDDEDEAEEDSDEAKREREEEDEHLRSYTSLRPNTWGT